MPRPNYNEIVVSSREEAEAIIDGLKEMIARYNDATIGDLYDLVGMITNFADNNMGWRDLSNASFSKTGEGYLLELPPPALIAS